jgi:hypothetical protein
VVSPPLPLLPSPASFLSSLALLLPSPCPAFT